MIKSLFSAIALLTISFAANAQSVSSNASQTVTLTLQNQIDISVSSATGTSFVFQSPADYSTGLTNLNASTFQVRSNRPWAVSVKSEKATFDGPAGNLMPAAKLGVRLANGSDFTPLSTGAVDFTSGGRGTNSFAVDYKANPGFDYDAGEYNINVIYTATQQ